MKAVNLEANAAVDHNSARSVTFGTKNPPYEPLSALVFQDGWVLTEWELTEEERARLIAGERVRVWILALGRPLQPIALEVTSEDKL